MSRDLQAAQAILARAEGKPLSLWQRSQIRAAVRAHEAQAGRTLADEHGALVMQAELLLDAGDARACRQRLDRADVLAAIYAAMHG